jgi:hypothetical protein
MLRDASSRMELPIEANVIHLPLGRLRWVEQQSWSWCYPHLAIPFVCRFRRRTILHSDRNEMML